MQEALLRNTILQPYYYIAFKLQEDQMYDPPLICTQSQLKQPFKKQKNL